MPNEGTEIENTILRAWSRCQSDHERADVLNKIDLARNEIRMERLAGSPSLRTAVADMDHAMNSIIMGGRMLEPISPHGNAQINRVASLVGLAGWIAMLLGAIADRRETSRLELIGHASHATRIESACEVRRPSAKPTNGAITVSTPKPDPLSVECLVCGRGVGESCNMGLKSS